MRPEGGFPQLYLYTLIVCIPLLLIGAIVESIQMLGWHYGVWRILGLLPIGLLAMFTGFFAYSIMVVFLVLVMGVGILIALMRASPAVIL